MRFDFALLGSDVDAWRHQVRLTLRAVAARVGVAPSALTRLRRGEPVSTRVVAGLMVLVGQCDVRRYITTD